MARGERFSVIDVTDMLNIHLTGAYLPGGDKEIEVISGSLEDALDWDVNRYFKFRTTAATGVIINFDFKTVEDYLKFAYAKCIPAYCQLHLIAGVGDKVEGSADRTRSFTSPAQFTLSTNWYNCPVPDGFSSAWQSDRGLVSFVSTEYNVVKMAGASMLVPLHRSGACVQLVQETPGVQPGEKYEFYIFLLRMFIWLPNYELARSL